MIKHAKKIWWAFVIVYLLLTPVAIMEMVNERTVNFSFIVVTIVLIFFYQKIFRGSGQGRQSD